jgi:sporulation protein YlmC with PRC-barrel domain
METNTASLVPLGESEYRLSDDSEDIRGRKVVDRNGDEIGKVKSLFIDEDEQRVRLLELESGGLLGFGSETRLVPVDAIAEISEDSVRIGATGEQVQSAPVYDPDVTHDDHYYDSVYAYYGYAPYWAVGSTPRSRHRG